MADAGPVVVDMGDGQPLSVGRHERRVAHERVAPVAAAGLADLERTAEQTLAALVETERQLNERNVHGPTRRVALLAALRRYSLALEELTEIEELLLEKMPFAALV